MGNNSTQKLVSVFLYLLLAVSVVILGFFIYASMGIELPEEAGFMEEIEAYGTTLDIFIGWAYVLIGIAAFAAIAFPIIRLVSQPKNLLKTIGALVAIAVVVFIAYSFSDGTPLKMPGYEGEDNVEGPLKFADTVLFSMYILLAGAVVSIVYSEVAKAFK